MNFNEYQQRMLTFLSPRGKDGDPLLNATLGMCGESGEFADLVKKNRFHGHELDKKKALLELGDVLFYVAQGAYAMGYNLEDIALLNVEKLSNRYPSGFNVEDSKLKKDES